MKKLMPHIRTALRHTAKGLYTLGLITITGGSALAAASLPAAAAATAAASGNFDLCPLINSIFFAALAPGLATLGIIIIGIAATFGRANANNAVLVIVGIAAMFGAKWLAQQFGGGC